MFPDGKHDDQSVGHATMLISVIAGPHVEKPADASPAQGTEQQSGKLAPADASILALEWVISAPSVSSRPRQPCFCRCKKLRLGCRPIDFSRHATRISGGSTKPGRPLRGCGR